MNQQIKQSETAAAPPGAAQPRAPRRAADHRARMQALMRTAGMLPVLVLLCVGFGFMTDGFDTEPSNPPHSPYHKGSMACRSYLVY